MKKLLPILAPLLFFLVACSAPRTPEEQWADRHSGETCDRYAGGGSGAEPFDGSLPYYGRQGVPYFAGPRLEFRDPYFTPDDPPKEDAVGECLQHGETG